MVIKNWLKIFGIVIIFSMTILIFMSTFKAQGSIKNNKYNIIVVKEGDTLWNIVRDNCADHKDIRKIIYNIKKANEISSNIYPGQEIKIPAIYCR